MAAESSGHIPGGHIPGGHIPGWPASGRQATGRQATGGDTTGGHGRGTRSKGGQAAGGHGQGARSTGGDTTGGHGRGTRSKGGQAPVRHLLWPWVIAAALVLLLPALINGMPFFYYDTAAYISLPRVGTPATGRELGAAPPAAEVFRGRAPAYRALGWAAQASPLGLWALVALQALATAGTLALAWRMVAPRLNGWLWLAGVAVLAGFTPLGLFAGMVMPDIFAGLLVLSAALLALGWGRMGRIARWGLGLLAGFAMLVHTSHLALGLVLVVLLALAGLARAPVARRGVAVLAAGVIAALVAEAAVTAVHARLSDRPLLTRPHVTANLVDRGPGTDYLRRACPEAGFAICAHVDRLPMDWIDFLFAVEPERGLLMSVPVAERRAIAAEHGRFVRAVLADDPLAFGRFAAGALAAQLADFTTADALIAPAALAAGRPRLPEAQRQALAASPAMRHQDRLTKMLDRATFWVAVLSMAAIAGMTAGAVVSGARSAGWGRRAGWGRSAGAHPHGGEGEGTGRAMAEKAGKCPGGPASSGGPAGDAGPAGGAGPGGGGGPGGGAGPAGGGAGPAGGGAGPAGGGGARQPAAGPADRRRLALAIALTLLAGLVINAAICGILAAPYGRFQARVMWLLPMAAVLLLLAGSRIGQGARASSPPGPAAAAPAPAQAPATQPAAPQEPAR